MGRWVSSVSETAKLAEPGPAMVLCPAEPVRRLFAEPGPAMDFVAELRPRTEQVTLVRIGRITNTRQEQVRDVVFTRGIVVGRRGAV